MDAHRFDHFTRLLATCSRRRFVTTACAAGALIFGPVRRAAGQDTGVACPLRLGQPCDDASACGDDACPTYACCAGLCVDLAADPANCGDCGAACDTGNCVENTCCPAGTVLCGDACVDPTTDATNCGGCGSVCPSDQPCLAGECGCAPPTVLCGDGCVDVTSDPANCGSCGLACDRDQTCCNSACTSVLTDRANCAACGTRCPDDSPTCCNGVCTATAADPANCGDCANACADGEFCQDGACTAATTGCDAGLTACGDTCADLSSDPANCGACGQACDGGSACQDGGCLTPDATPAPPPPTANACTVQRDGQNLVVALSLASRTDNLTLDYTATLTRSDLASVVQAVFQRDAQPILQIDARHTPDGRGETHLTYGPPFTGIAEATFRSDDGKTVTGTIDGRALAPVPIGAASPAATFLDGEPAPAYGVDPAVAAAIDRMLKRVTPHLRQCAPEQDAFASVRAFLPPTDIGGDTCSSCEKDCNIDVGICDGAALGACVLSFFGYAECVELAIAGCSLAFGRCLQKCDESGGPCCPVQCQGYCCDQGQTCANDNQCCPVGRVVCGGACCPAGIAACNDGTCCPADVVACRGRCCAKGETCTSEGVCCPPGTVSCHGVCCKQDEVCRDEGVCCPAKNAVCPGPVCCGANAPCIDGQCCEGHLHVCGDQCCAPFDTCCNGQCCGPDGDCLNGACCPKDRSCGSLCCPDGQVCQDKTTGICGACPSGTDTCQDLGTTICCPPGEPCCMLNGQIPSCCGPDHCCADDPVTGRACYPLSDKICTPR